MKKLKCPKCGSENINQYRTPNGPIWCGDCGFEAAKKQIFNPFVVKIRYPSPVWLIQEPKSSDECEWQHCPDTDYIRCDHILRTKEKGEIECSEDKCPIFFKRS